MKNTEETKRSFSFSVEWGKLRERGKARKRRMLRQIELMRLRRIRQQNVPQYTYCKNCGTKLEGMYCYQCGQYALDPRQPFWKYFKQYFENVYQYDSKMWRTLWLMFTRPGLLTCEFNAGKINSYMHPFRLYMCVSVVFFTVIFMLTSELVNFKMAQQGNPELSASLVDSLVFLAGLFIYLSVSFHTVYREGWGKTLIKNLLFSGIFTLLALVIATVMLTWVLYGSMEDSGIL